MKDKKGFDGQWVEIFTAGTHHDDQGNKHVIDAAFLEQVVANFQPQQHEAPVVVGHPQTDAPAYGWTCGLRVEGNVLQAQFCDVDPNFEQLVREGKFKKRSASFYLDANKAPGGRVPQLRHVGFLGAQPPAVKGLRGIQFTEGEAVTFEQAAFSEGESMKEETDKKSIGEQIAEFFREKFGSKSDAPSGSFGEADIKRLIGDAVSAAEARFAEEKKGLEQKITSLSSQVDKTSGSATRAEIVTFCESLGAGKFLPAFKRMGVVDFMEVLAALDDKKIAVVSFSEEGGKEVEKTVEIAPLTFFKHFLSSLPQYIEFGEKLGTIKVTGTGAEIVDPKEMDKLRSGMGMKKEGGDK